MRCAGEKKGIFFVNIPFCVACFAISFVTMKKIKNAQKNMPIDLIGSFLVAGATVCLVLFATWGGQDFGPLVSLSSR